MGAAQIAENYRRVRGSIPDEVALVVAAKTRSAEELAAVIEAGAEIIGENYVQEAEAKSAALGEQAASVEWHMIGHVQTNKIGKALTTFDVIQTVDSIKLARGIDRRAEGPVRVLMEVNIAGEQSKSGVTPDAVRTLVEEISTLENLRLEGLMTMEPYFGDPEMARPYFRRMKAIFDELRSAGLAGVDLKVLSMGMSQAYATAIEEGSNMVRVGTAIFGERQG